MCFRIGDVYALSFLSMIGVLLVQCLFFAVTVETMLSGVTELPFTVFLAAMQPIHLAIGFVEGLEWAMERVAGTSELVAEGGAYEAAETVQSALSFLPGYAFKGSESAAGTTVSGLVGAAIVAQLCIGFSMAF